MSQQCQGQKYVGNGRWGSWQRCDKVAKVEREGKHFCRVHDPVRKAEKDAERHEKWNAKFNAEMAAGRRRDLAVKACENLSEADLKQIVGAGGFKTGMGGSFTV